MLDHAHFEHREDTRGKVDRVVIDLVVRNRSGRFRTLKDEIGEYLIPGAMNPKLVDDPVDVVQRCRRDVCAISMTNNQVPLRLAVVAPGLHCQV